MRGVWCAVWQDRLLRAPLQHRHGWYIRCGVIDVRKRAVAYVRKYIRTYIARIVYCTQQQWHAAWYHICQCRMRCRGVHITKYTHQWDRNIMRHSPRHLAHRSIAVESISLLHNWSNSCNSKDTPLFSGSTYNPPVALTSPLKRHNIRSLSSTNTL